MPNGGSDCCGTCEFNASPRRPPGNHVDPRQPSACTLRGGLPIPGPFSTYCANHPRHNPDRVRVPVGPVLVLNDADYGRRPWVPSPDADEVRAGVLALLRAADTGTADDPRRSWLLAQAVRQLGEWADPRALPDLDRVRGFPVPPTDDPAEIEYPHGARRLVLFARAALAKIIPPEAVAPYRSPAAVAVAAGFAATGDPAARAVLADALEEAGCPPGPALDYLRSPAPTGRPCWVADLVRGAGPPPG